MLLRRFIFVILTMVVVTAGARAEPESAAATDVKAACLTMHKDAQLSRRSGALLAARAAIVGCAQSSCPAVISAECAMWLGEVEREIPSIVVTAIGDEGDLHDVRIVVDGITVRENLDGKPIALDPGPHTMGFFRADEPGREQNVILNVGQRNRLLELDFRTPVSSPVVAPVATPVVPPVEMTRPVPWGVWVLGGAALTGVGGFVGLALVGRAEEEKLATTCSPFCSDGQITSVRIWYGVADGVLAGAVLAGATGAWWYLVRPEVPSEPLAP